MKENEFESLMKKIFGKSVTDNLLWYLYRRFKPLRFSTDGKEIDMESQLMEVIDFTLGLTILSSLRWDEKLRLIYDICDDDGDHCLRPAEILVMLQKLERLFAHETAQVELESSILTYTAADKRAEHKFHYVMAKLKKRQREQEMEK